jgi:hypothetical protein
MNDRKKPQRVRVAPYNPNPQWPTGYFQVLEELGVEEPQNRGAGLHGLLPKIPFRFAQNVF